MAAFRKFVPALALLVLILGLQSVASAQVTCVPNIGPSVVRAEGLTELTGDIVLNCTGGTPTTVGNVIPTVNISIFLTTAVTSRLISGGVIGNSEALLMIDDPAPGTAKMCATAPTCPIVANGGALGAFKGGVVNTWPGTVTAAGNRIDFVGIPVEPPATTFNRVYRITNVRANASAVAPGAFGTPGTITAQITATPATGLSGGAGQMTLSSNSAVVAYVQTGLNFSLLGYQSTSSGLSGSGVGISQCSSFRSSDSSSYPRGVAMARFSENFQTAFKPRGFIPGQDPANLGAGTIQAQNTPGIVNSAASETGFYDPATFAAPYNVAGLADFGTRLKVTFANIPAGVQIFVTSFNVSGASPTMLGANITNGSGTVARLVGSETGFFFPRTDVATNAINTVAYTYAEVTMSNGSGSAVWEVVAADPQISQNYDFAIFARTVANVTSNSPGIGTGTAAGTLAPTAVPPFTAADFAKAQASNFPIPRFADTSSAKTLLKTSICRTILLFPYVAATGGFDTGIAISNTTSDPLGTTAQTGTCDLNFYAPGAPAVLTTPAIAGGNTYGAVLSTIAPGFSGYIIAVCNFQYAHALAYISDPGSRNFAMGYLALVLPDGGRQNTTSGVSLANGTGELLGQ